MSGTAHAFQDCICLSMFQCTCFSFVEKFHKWGVCSSAMVVVMEEPSLEALDIPEEQPFLELIDLSDGIPELPEDLDPESCSEGEETPEVVGLTGFRQRWKRARSDMAGFETLPSGDGYSADDNLPDTEDSVDVGGRSSVQDDNIAVTNAFIDRNKQSGIVLPWENPMLAAIFGEVVPSPSLGMPSSWCADITKAVGVDDGLDGILGEFSQQADVSSCIKNIVDRPFLDGVEVDTRNAIGKLHFLLGIDHRHSEIGLQISEPGANVEMVMAAIIGTKSPSTVSKRVNALLAFYRWHSISLSEDFLPLKERAAWAYMQDLMAGNAAPTKAASFMSALRFAHHILQIHGAKDCIDSRRLVGASELMLSKKRVTQQARPLTVLEMKKLHSIAASTSQPVDKRVIAAHLLLMAYGRCRNSDLVHVSEVRHDTTGGSAVSGSSGYMQVTTRYHKSARTAASKSWLLPIVVSGEGVVHEPWLDVWITCRKQAGLPVSGVIDGAVLPAPVGKGWSVRPVTCSEPAQLLRLLISVDDGSVASHSLKSTCLSWAAKAGLPRESRRLLGRHADALQGSDSFYSRDLAIGPVRELQTVIRWIREGLFFPDNNRAEYFPSGHPMASSATIGLNFQPKTPALPRPAVLVQRDADQQPTGLTTPGMEAVVKEEPVQVATIDEVIEIDSDETGSSTSTSNPADESSGEDEAFASETIGIAAGPTVFEEEQHALVKHRKSKIIHSVPGLEPFEHGSTYEGMEAMQNKFTACGRNVSKLFEPCFSVVDWTAKCRVCFRGRRRPPTR